MAFVISLLFIILAFFLLALLRTWQLEHSINQKRFAAGTIPNPRPDGFYPGTVFGQKVFWLGKRFDNPNTTGVNLFKNLAGKTVEKYAFKTSIGKGIRDKNLEVIRIDYNVSGPLWVRPILDEIVEIAPNHYLGKLQLRVIPGLPLTLVFFELNAQSP